MNIPANAMPESAAAQIAPVPVPPGRRMYWLVCRELWESRSVYVAPLAVAGIVLIGFFLSSFAGIWEKALRNYPPQAPHKFSDPYGLAELLVMGAAFVTAIFYCLDALHGERRDRSILFWKSLPISDVETVLSKALIPIVVIPLLSFVITVATQWLMLLWSSVVLLISGGDVAALWRMPWLQGALGLFYHLVAFHGLWYAPIYAWLLLASAWSRRAPFLWAGLPILAIGVIERIAFRSSLVANLLLHRLGGGSDGNEYTPGSALQGQMHIHLGHFLLSPGLWIGLLFAAILLALSVRLRRSQGPL